MSEVFLIVVGPENRHEGLLRDFDVADHLHALFALFLLFEQLAFAGDVAAVTLGGNVFAQGGDVFARDDFGADRCLQRNLELMPRNQAAQFGDNVATAVFSAFTWCG